MRAFSSVERSDAILTSGMSGGVCMQANQSSAQCGSGIVMVWMPWCTFFKFDHSALVLLILDRPDLSLTQQMFVRPFMTPAKTPPDHLLTHSQQQEKFESARFELHSLLNQPSLTGVPLLVVSRYHLLTCIIPARHKMTLVPLSALAWKQE